MSNSAAQTRALQMRAERDGATSRTIAEHGVDNAGSSLPHRDAIQESFGRHDVSHVRAEIGGAAAEATASLGAHAYALGDRVGFREQPDLHTAAHEAAHVVQQQRGVQLAGGVGRAGDAYETHADQVADLVVAGKSAEAELDELPEGNGNALVQLRDDDGIGARMLRELISYFSSKESDAPTELPESIIQTDNLSEALRLMQGVTVPYELEPTQDQIKSIVAQGKEDQLAELNCGLFTALTLVASGWQAYELYVGPDGRYVAYIETGGELTWVTHLMLINGEVEATKALLETQNARVHDDGTSSPPIGFYGARDSSARYILSEHNRPQHPQPDGTDKPYWVWEHGGTFVGMDAEPEHQFGAGAVAIAMGKEVTPHERKPGDLQQQFSTSKSGEYTGSGHSAQVHSVLGPGICYFSMTDQSAPIPHAVGQTPDRDGWYEILEGQGAWALSPNTNPEHVAAFKARAFQLIDANTTNDGRDQAIAIGTTRPTEAFTPDAASHLYSIGRLPTSKWSDWAPKRPPAEVTTIIPR